MNVSRQPGRIKNIFLSDRGDRQFLKCSTFGPVLDASLIVPWRARTGKVSRPIKGEHRFNRGSALGRGCRGGERHKSRPSWFQFLERSERRSRFSPLVRCHLRWPIYLFVGFAWFSCYFLAIPTVASVFFFFFFRWLSILINSRICTHLWKIWRIKQIFISILFLSLSR